MNNIFISVVVSTIVAILLTPLVMKFAVKINAVDIPNEERRVHTKPTPLLGGLAVYSAFIVGVLIKKGPISLSELGIIVGATIVVIGGIIDDLKGLRPAVKVSFQIIGAICLILSGVEISRITNPFSIINPWLDLSVLSIPITILWIVGVTNAFNLIDGLDGLAAGIALISSCTIFIIAVLNNRYEAAVLTAILSGGLLGFLPYNFNPADIFMGDTGAQLLGFLLAAISIEGTIKSATAFALAVPILAFGLPIYDTLFAMIRRKMNGKPISQADRGHLHHRLLDMGLSHKGAVIIMYSISVVLGGISIVAMQISTQRAYFLVTFVVLIIFFTAWKSGFFQHKE